MPWTWSAFACLQNIINHGVSGSHGPVLVVFTNDWLQCEKFKGREAEIRTPSGHRLLSSSRGILFWLCLPLFSFSVNAWLSYDSGTSLPTTVRNGPLGLSPDISTIIFLFHCDFLQFSQKKLPPPFPCLVVAFTVLQWQIFGKNSNCQKNLQETQTKPKLRKQRIKW